MTEVANNATTRSVVLPFTRVMGDFLDNVLRYPRYLISFSLGIFFALFGWLKPLFKNPVTAVALLGFLVGGFFFLFFTLRAMLGLTTA